jgi:fatty-acyl-CoA synthase
MGLGINVFTGYGMSETCPILSIASFKPHMKDWDRDAQIKIRCRTGLPISNVVIEIVDQQGNPLPHDGKTTGEIVTRTPWLTQGYLKDQEKSEELWENGWLHTGDIGFIDEEGYLQVTDRLKDVIKTGGEWISSLALEDIISRHPAVSEAAVIGVPDEKWGERPLALVVLKPNMEKITAEDLRKVFIEYAEKGGIPRYGVPDRVVITDSISKTSVGKLNKKEMRKQYR